MYSLCLKNACIFAETSLFPGTNEKIYLIVRTYIAIDRLSFGSFCQLFRYCFIQHTLDKNIWGERINPNKYFATICLLCCALSGILWGGSNYLAGMFDWDIDITLTISLAAVIIFIGYNIAESIIATDSAKIAVLRSLMMIGIMILGFIAGALGSVILLLILTIIIAIYFLLTVIRVALSGGSNGSGRPVQDKPQ